MKSVAIIGAGIAGLTLARQLSSQSKITLFEKARGVSGRMSTRYADPYQFDHGAQFFTAKTEEFQAFLKPLIAQGVVTRWDARFAELNRHIITRERRWSEEYPHYVGTPKMNQIGKYLAEGLDVKLHTRINEVARDHTGWRLRDQSGETAGPFDWVISTLPPAQASALLPQSFKHYQMLSNTSMLGCYALMLGFNKPLPLPWDAALVRNADISWISVNSSKPGRPNGFSLLIDSTNAWAERHLDDERQQVQQYLCSEVSQVIGHDVMQADHIALHGWRYANIGKQQGVASLLDEENKLAACGDWCIQGRVESAFTSAIHLANRLKQYL